MDFKPNDNFVYYLYFIKERMNIFWRKLEGQKRPWTDDPILDLHKFTNVYRMLDRSSQYLLKNVIYNGKEYTQEDIFWRILLYKHFNLPNTWGFLEEVLGDVKFNTPQEDIVEVLKEYSATGKPVYSNAYMLTAPFMKKQYFLDEFGLKSGMPKFKIYTNIFYKEFAERGKMNKILKAKNFKEMFDVFMSVPSFAGFLSYQFIQDLNYSPLFDFDMNKFCAAGPGTTRGVERTFELNKGVDPGDVVVWVYNNFDSLVKEYSDKFDIDISPKLIEGYPPQVPDFSNCFCETDKYLRGVNVQTEGKEIKGKRIKAKYINESRPNIEYTFPPKWNISLK